MLGLSKEKKTGQRTLSREELEINQVLNSPASGSQSANNTEQNKTPTSAQPKKSNRAEPLSMGDFGALIKNSVVAGFSEALGKAFEAKNSNSRKRTRTDSHSSQVDSDLPEVGVDTVQKGSEPQDEVFGSEVNTEPLYSDDQESDEDDFHPFDIRQPSPDNSNTKDKLSKTVPPNETVKISTDDVVIEPDVDLPSVSSRPPATWFPKKKIMTWFQSAADKEWSVDDRKKLLDKFHPPAEYDQFLNPVKMPKKLYHAIKAPSIKKKDYLFSRSNAEKELFNASSDLCSSLHPFIEAVSLLDDIPNSSNIKNLLGQGIIGVCSANIRISRGRREVARRCVKLDCADALYSVPPSHKSIFGTNSDSEALKAAKEMAKSDSSFVHKPAYKKPYRSYNQGFLYQPQDQYKPRNNQFFQKPYYEYQYQKEKNQSQRHRGRGRGQRGRGQRKSSKPAYSKE